MFVLEGLQETTWIRRLRGSGQGARAEPVARTLDPAWVFSTQDAGDWLLAAGVCWIPVPIPCPNSFFLCLTIVAKLGLKN